MPTMTMQRTLGKQPETMPAGFFKAVEFPVLALLDTKTGDRRMLLSEGADSRVLPLSIKFASKTSAMGGHDGAEVSGTLFEVTFDGDTMSGKGFLLNDDNGRRHARLIATGAMRGNSIDLAEVRARFVEDLDTGDYWIEFTEFKLAATTGVSTPAFQEAHATVEPLTDEELTASFGDPMEPLVAQVPEEFYVNILGPVEELTASLALVNFDDFYRPESDIPHKVIIDEDLNVYGNLALWESCWGDEVERCLRPPRPRDNYASFNQPGVMTERGLVSTGPIFAYGGHRKAASAPTIEQAYGGIENCWCDVRVTEGKHGPWLSGRVRPGVPDDVVYAARASRISGHWVNGNLRAIVSVNVEAFNVPGAPELVAGFAFATGEVRHLGQQDLVEEVIELVASFPPCAQETPPNQLVINFNSDIDVDKFLNAMGTYVNTSGGTPVTAYWSVRPEPVIVVDDPIVITETNELQAWADQKLAALLEADDDGWDQ